MVWKVADLLVTRNGREGVAVDRALDTNIFAVLALAYTTNPSRGTRTEGSFANLLRDVVIDGTDWRKRWKAIYLITGLVCLLSRWAGDGQKRPR